MPLQPDGRLAGRTMPSPADHMVSHFDPWRAFNLGTTTASITVNCPAGTTPTRRTQVAIQTLYATATGSGGKVTVKSASSVIMEFRLESGFPLMLSFYPGNITTEPGEDLTIEVTGATSDASVTATGVFYR